MPYSGLIIGTKLIQNILRLDMEAAGCRLFKPVLPWAATAILPSHEVSSLSTWSTNHFLNVTLQLTLPKKNQLLIITSQPGTGAGLSYFDGVRLRGASSVRLVYGLSQTQISSKPISGCEQWVLR